MSTVTLKNVYKIYENSEKKPKEELKPAVSDFCMEIQDKEFIVFVGPSGCGKSTTLRMIAGLEEVTSGEIWIDDKIVNDMAPKDRDIAMVFQNYALYPHMTVYDNMAYGLRLRKIPDVKRQPLSKEFLAELVDDVKRDKKGEVVFDEEGNPIHIKRKRTGAEIDAAKRTQPPLLDKDGKEIPIMRNYTKYEIDEKILAAAKILAIEEYLKRKPKALSGGQRQRVALGRTIVRNPKVFLLDEPLSNLDAKLRATMRSEIIKLHDRLGATFIYVTHDQIEAMTMGTRIVVMKDGFIQQIGAPQELYDHPINTFVAGFIGTPQMNFFEGRVFPDGSIIFANDQKITLSKKAFSKFDKEKIGEGLDIIMGIRPGDLKLLDKDTDMSVKVKVEVVEALGNESLIYANLDTKSESLIYANLDSKGEGSIEKNSTSIIAAVKLKENPVRNSIITLGLDETALHLFDKKTEISIAVKSEEK